MQGTGVPFANFGSDVQVIQSQMSKLQLSIVWPDRDPASDRPYSVRPAPRAETKRGPEKYQESHNMAWHGMAWRLHVSVVMAVHDNATPTETHQVGNALCSSGGI